MDSLVKKSYGICTKQSVLLNHNTNKFEILRQGDLIRILDSDSVQNDKIIVKIYNSDKNTFRNDLLDCQKQDIDYVVEDLWLFLIGTNDKAVRTRIYNQCEFVLRLKLGNEVTIKSYENDTVKQLKAVITLIGPVNDIGIGNFVGVQLPVMPDKAEVLFQLYKKYYNTSLSMFIFRIEQLLDILKEAEPQETGQHEFISSEIDRCHNDSTEFSNWQEESKILFGKTPITSMPNNFENDNQNVSSNRSPSLSSNQDQFASSALHTPIHDINSNYESAISKFSSKSDSTVLNDINNFNNNPTYSANINSLAPFIVQKEVVVEPLVDLSTNEKGAIPKINKPKTIRNGRPKSENYNVPRRIQYTRTTISKPNYSYPKRKKPLQCLVCHSRIKLELLILKCMHCICIKCFSNNMANIIGTNQIFCPYNQQNNNCKYRLRPFEVDELRKKFNEFIQVAPVTQQNKPVPPNNNFDSNGNAEELFTCLTDGCNGKWFIVKSSKMNLFKCPLCKINNCVQCKAIHDNMTCKEYLDTLQVNVTSKAFRMLSDKINNLVVSILPDKGIDPIPEMGSGPDGNEVRMECNNKKCPAIWFVSKNDKNCLFKCPLCESYNCASCKAIHKNQTCDEYKAQKSRYFNIFRNNEAQYKPLPRVVKKVVDKKFKNNNNLVKRQWNCEFCTFENFSFGYICKMCRQLNTDK